MFQAIRQATKEDHPFDPTLAAAFRLAEKGLDEREAAQMRLARVRLLLYPELEEEERARLEQERALIEQRAAASLTDEERARLAQAEQADESNDESYSDLERSLRQHVESAELRLNPAARDKLLQARRSGPSDKERAELIAEKKALEAKAWAGLREEERVALDFFEDALPTSPEAREQLARERASIEQRAVARLDPERRAKVEAAELQQRAEASLSEEERARLRAAPERRQAERELIELRAQAEELLGPEDRTVLLRARLLVRRDQAEGALPPKERKALEQARQRLIHLREREELEASAEERLSSESRARLDYLRQLLSLRKDHQALRERAEQSLQNEDRDRLQRLRAQLRLTPKERERLERRLRQLAFGNLSNEKGTFSPEESEREALGRAHETLAELLRVAPFNAMLDRFALEDDEQGAERLTELLMRETRERRFTRQGERREVIVRQGDYGSTAFLILEGRVRILIQSDEQARATAASLGSWSARRKGWLGLLARWLRASPGREVREADRDARYAAARARAEPVPIVIKDFARVPAQSKDHTLGEGEVFGEIAALTRTPRTATVVPDSEAVRLLEIRWQGLRDLVNEDEAFQKVVEERYRDSSRRAYVFRTGLFAGVGDTEAIRRRVATADLEGLFRHELGWRAPRPRASFGPVLRLPPTPPAPLRCRLRVWRAGREEPFEIRPDLTVLRIGSGAENELRLPRRPTISEDHAELRLELGRWYLKNLSRHGTVVDGAVVRTRCVLFPGAKLRIGETWILFEAVHTPPAPGGPEVPLTLFAESPIHNGIGGIKAYVCTTGDAPLPDEATCRALVEQVKRQEYLHREESRHLVVFTRAGANEQEWRWLLPTQDDREPDAHEQGSLRFKGDPDELVRRLIHFLALEEVIKVTEFVSFGKFRWFERSPEEEQDGTHWAARLEGQPLIASQGHYPNGVYMIRAGFARLTQETDQGERTVSYLRPESPYGYGLEEVIENYLSKREELVASRAAAPRMTLPFTLRAVGYADTVFFPTSVLERFVLPSYDEGDLRALIHGEQQERRGLRALKVVSSDVPADLRDFLVDHHLINGTQSMVINLDRCTRCDDCVRGCASTHQRDPRFVRHGLVHGNLMVANACMHCVDPVCLIDCPTGAIHRPLGGGLVVIQDETCIGCSACAHNCPYDNIRMVPIRDGEERVVTKALDTGVGEPQLRATKCDLCYDQAVGETACVRACPHDALRRVDLSDLDTLRDLARWLQ